MGPTGGGGGGVVERMDEAHSPEAVSLPRLFYLIFFMQETV